VLNIPDWTHFDDGRDLVRVRFDAVLGDDVPQEHALGNSEGAVLQVLIMLNCRRFFKVSSRSDMRLLLFRDFIMMSSA
jgi:hypothetical protein